VTWLSFLPIRFITPHDGRRRQKDVDTRLIFRRLTQGAGRATWPEVWAGWRRWRRVSRRGLGGDHSEDEGHRPKEWELLHRSMG
jgi:hypothetical protein